MRMRVGVSIICGGRWVEHSAEGRGGGASLSWWYERVWVNIAIHAMKTQRLSYVSSKATHSSFLPSTAQYRHQLLQYRYQYH